MIIRSLTLAALTVGIAFASPVVAEDFLSPAQAERLGMTEAWHRQVGAIGGAEGIVDIQVWVNKSVQHEYIEVVLKGAVEKPTVLERFPTNRRRLDGREIGKAEATRLAKLSVLQLKRRGIEADIRSVSVDQVRLHVLTSAGNLSAYDGETGDQLWSIRLGLPQLGYGTMGVSDQFVTFLNGTNLHQVVAMEGTVEDAAGLPVSLPAGRALDPVHVKRIPLFGVVNAGQKAVVVLNRSGMELHHLGDPKVEPGYDMFDGRATTKPVGFPNSGKIMWPTEHGFVYAMDLRGTPVTMFRLPVDGVVEGGISAATDDRFFFGCTGGRVYGVRATSKGEVLWNQSLGEPFYRAPFVSGDRLWISSSYGLLHCLSTETGQPVWERPVSDVDQVFSHVGSRLIGRSREHQLVVLDAASGETILRSHDFFVDRWVVNEDTDRVYLVGKGGMIQCLRPNESEFPVFLRQIVPATAPTTTADPKAGETKVAPVVPPAQADPFGGGTDPAADPFGGGEDPFGAPAAPDPADPFGGAADPFGGN